MPALLLAVDWLINMKHHAQHAWQATLYLSPAEHGLVVTQQCSSSLCVVPVLVVCSMPKLLRHSVCS